MRRYILHLTYLQDNGNKTEIFSNNSDLIPPVGVWPRTRRRRRLQRRGPSTGRSDRVRDRDRVRVCPGVEGRKEKA